MNDIITNKKEPPQRLKISVPVIVEGKYDKAKLSYIIDAHIITTDGFGIFREDEKRALLRRLAELGGVIVLTDSDGGGRVIRGYLNSVLPKGSIIHLYIPEIEGKEPRKTAPSKEGLVGVEGVPSDVIRKLFEPFADTAAATDISAHGGKVVTKADFYADGLSGGAGSALRRAELAQKLNLPRNMSANSLLEAVNMLCSYERYRGLIDDDSR